MLKAGSKWISKQLMENASHSNLSDIQFIEPLTPRDSSTIKLYDSTNIDSIEWPLTEEGQYAKSYLLPLIKDGVHHYIDNIQTEIKILKLGELILPISINNAEYENSYVCSPYSFYVSYAQASLDIIKNRGLKTFFSGLLRGVSKLFKYLQFNKVVIVNNWLLPTNLYPKIDVKLITEITQFVQNLFPNHVIVFRSIDAFTNQSQYQALKEHSFKLIATRQIFITDTSQKNVFETRLFKSDLKLLRSSGYEIVEDCCLSKVEISRMLELYQGIYITKYSGLNPQVNQHYIQLALDRKILRFKALKKDGIIDGVAGYVCRNGIMTCPLFGYDKTKPQQVGLYRLLSTVLMLEAKEKEMIYHQSAGASTYKKIRKAQDHIEYTAVYDKHLPFKRKIPWLFFKALFNSLGIYYMKKY